MFFFSSRRRHTRCALVTGVQTCALPIYTASTPNSWAQMAYDEKLGLIYVPTGNATPDHYGRQRRPIDDEISSALMALDIETGRRRWIFQTTHHDLWDYDLGSQPVLFEDRKSTRLNSSH